MSNEKEKNKVHQIIVSAAVEAIAEFRKVPISTVVEELKNGVESTRLDVLEQSNALSDEILFQLKSKDSITLEN